MASYEEIFKSKMNWGNVLERAAAVPLDRSSMFDSYSDAVKYAKGDGSDSRGFGKTSYIGQVITVYENDTVNVYTINGNRELDKLSFGFGSVNVDTFEDALVLANSDNEGQVIYVKEKSFSYTNETGETVYTTDEEVAKEDSGYTTYDAGTYVVVGNNALQKLAQSTVTGDLSSEIASLQNSVDNLKNNSIYIEDYDI